MSAMKCIESKIVRNKRTKFKLNAAEKFIFLMRVICFIHVCLSVFSKHTIYF